VAVGFEQAATAMADAMTAARPRTDIKARPGARAKDRR
jgi:hypothetical protein